MDRSLLTSALFVIAKFALGFYFGNTTPDSAYGAAGTIILIMLWVSYAGLIVLFGAEFTQTYAMAHGRKVEPTDDAMSATEEPEPELRAERGDRAKINRPTQRHV